MKTHLALIFFTAVSCGEKTDADRVCDRMQECKGYEDLNEDNYIGIINDLENVCGGVRRSMELNKPEVATCVLDCLNNADVSNCFYIPAMSRRDVWDGCRRTHDEKFCLDMYYYTPIKACLNDCYGY
jgi:hypothetical protein